MSRKTYYTKKDLLSFGRFLLSDERRLQKQKEARAAIEAGTINPKPWTVTERILTPEDFEEWKNQNEKQN